jgi:hypothetical protein
VGLNGLPSSHASRSRTPAPSARPRIRSCPGGDPGEGRAELGSLAPGRSRAQAGDRMIGAWSRPQRGRVRFRERSYPTINGSLVTLHGRRKRTHVSPTPTRGGGHGKCDRIVAVSPAACPCAPERRTPSFPTSRSPCPPPRTEAPDESSARFEPDVLPRRLPPTTPRTHLRRLEPIRHRLLPISPKRRSSARLSYHGRGAPRLSESQRGATCAGQPAAVTASSGSESRLESKTSRRR